MKQEAEDLNAKARTEKHQAQEIKRQAEEKSQKLQAIINYDVKQIAIQLKNEQNKVIKEKSTDFYAKAGAVTYALIGWNFLITIVLVSHNWSIISTVPEWFASRWGNIVWIGKGIKAIYIYFYELLQPHMHDFFAGVISLLPLIVIFAVVAILSYMAYGLITTTLNVPSLGEMWEHYECYNKTLLKKTTTVAIVMGSIPLAIWLAGFNNPINVVTWWLMLGIGLNVIYHAITYQRY